MKLVRGLMQSWFVALSAGAFPLLTGTASADAPRVHFDVATMIACRDVTPPDFAELHTDERLVEARLSISSLIQSGKEAEIVEFMYLIDSPQCTLQVADYLPKTTLATDVVGSIGVERKEDRSRTFGLNITGEITEQVKAVANTGATATNSEKLCYERLPPLEMLSAAGTLHRSTGAYFKLKPSPRTSLEGSRDFLLILRVPSAWRADYIRVRCAAQGNQRGMVRHLDQQVPCGKGEFFVALYAEGDLAAKAAAARLVGCEQQLRSVVASSRNVADASRNSSAVQRFGAILASTEQQPQLPPEWFDEMLSTPSRANFARYAKHLPPNVRQSAEAYHSAKSSVQRLNGRP
jgi:hypothetical protein